MPFLYKRHAFSLKKANKLLTNWKCVNYLAEWVGLVICKSTDETVVEWSLRDIYKPLGVSSYQLEEVVERTVKELEQRKTVGRK